MKFLRKLQNPFVLAGQGFVLGAIFFFATHEDRLQASAVQAVPAAASVSLDR